MADAKHAIKIGAVAHDTSVVSTGPEHPLKCVAGSDNASVALAKHSVTSSSVLAANCRYICAIRSLRYSHCPSPFQTKFNSENPNPFLIALSSCVSISGCQRRCTPLLIGPEPSQVEIVSLNSGLGRTNASVHSAKYLLSFTGVSSGSGKARQNMSMSPRRPGQPC